jgi:hypothetical protein
MPGGAVEGSAAIAVSVRLFVVRNHGDADETGARPLAFVAGIGLVP